MRPVTLLALLPISISLGFCPVVSSPLLVDEFNDAVIDSALWTVSTPFAGSSVTTAGGSAEFRQRGRLLSVPQFAAGVVVTGRFQILGGRDQFTIVTRTDGVSTNPAGEFDTGIRFQAISDGGASRLEIAPVAGWVGISYASIGLPIANGVWYEFKVIDTGTMGYFFLDDMSTPKLVHQLPTGLGDRLGLFNIESAGSLAQVDFVEVNAYEPPCAPSCEEVEALKTRIEQLEMAFEEFVELFGEHRHDKGSGGRLTGPPQ